MITFEELNIVRKLKKQLADEETKLQGFKDLAESITPQFSRTTYREGKKEISYTCLDVSPKGSGKDSRVEMIATLIIDTEKIIEGLEKRLKEETEILMKKIVENFPKGVEHRLLFNRYVIGKSFKEIAHLMRYSLRQIFYVHKRILKRLHSVA